MIKGKHSYNANMTKNLRLKKKILAVVKFLVVIFSRVKNIVIVLVGGCNGGIGSCKGWGKEINTW